jgi:hypothetical protein
MGIPYKIAYDTNADTEYDAGCSMRTRRCGVELKELSRGQSLQLSDLIDAHVSAAGSKQPGDS